MGPGGVGRRRLFGGAVLGAALLMLICGETFLEEHLSGLVFLLYWMLCLALTGVAVLVALVDARVTRIQLQHEKRQLLEQTVKEIQDEAISRKRRSNNSRSRPRHDRN